MNDDAINRQPAALEAIQRDTAALGFTMASEAKTGALLAALAASKPGGCWNLAPGRGLALRGS